MDVYFARRRRPPAAMGGHVQERQMFPWHKTPPIAKSSSFGWTRPCPITHEMSSADTRSFSSCTGVEAVERTLGRRSRFSTAAELYGAGWRLVAASCVVTIPPGMGFLRLFQIGSFTCDGRRAAKPRSSRYRFTLIAASISEERRIET